MAPMDAAREGVEAMALRGAARAVEPEEATGLREAEGTMVGVVLAVVDVGTGQAAAARGRSRGEGVEVEVERSRRGGRGQRQLQPRKRGGSKQRRRGARLDPSNAYPTKWQK